jgi:hypothetical protein
LRAAPLGILLIWSVALSASGDEATIRIDARGPGRAVSPYMAGACIEDVNHEVYGGIYSQMVFGESFQEPPTTSPVKGFAAFGGEWNAKDGELDGSAGPGPRLVSNAEGFISGEAAGFLGVPDFNIDESPRDMADFVEYANGPAETEWGRRRAADGHAGPYGLKFLQLGNEERVDDAYYAKFAAIAEAVWATDPQITLVVGDFAYNRLIDDPMRFTGADSRITSLAAHQRILVLAKRHDREVWFDVHVWTDGPGAHASLKALPTYLDALEKLANGAKHQVVVFELNANNHAQRRALANAQAIGAVTRDGRLPVVASANCLRPDGQNDDGWDQGLLFLKPSKTWLQPPGYVTRMVARYDLARTAGVELTGGAGNDTLDVTATRSEDGKRLTLRVVNLGDRARSARIRLDGYMPSLAVAETVELSARPDATNTASDPERVKHVQGEWRHGITDGATAPYSFPPHSVTVLGFQ